MKRWAAGVFLLCTFAIGYVAAVLLSAALSDPPEKPRREAARFLRAHEAELRAREPFACGWGAEALAAAPAPHDTALLALVRPCCAPAPVDDMRHATARACKTLGLP
jgi:hypothetical protein